MIQRCYSCGCYTPYGKPLGHYKGCEVEGKPSRSFGNNIFEVYHHDSPGVRVLVRRNVFQQMYRSRVFSGVGEKHLTHQEAFGHLKYLDAYRETQRVREEFDRVLASKKDVLT